MTDDEIELAQDMRMYGACYWKYVDGKKVRVSIEEVRYINNEAMQIGGEKVEAKHFVMETLMEHEPSVGLSDDWYTPPEIFKALGVRFDLDPCSPGPSHWVPADKVYTIADNGLEQRWGGFVFMNPPFGGRNGHVPWLRKFLRHSNGIAIVRAYTSAGWFHDWMPSAELILFPRGKTKFLRPDGSVGKQPGGGIALIGMGERGVTALMRSGLGIYCVPCSPPHGRLSSSRNVHLANCPKGGHFACTCGADGSTPSGGTDGT